MTERASRRPGSLSFNFLPVAGNTFRETVRQPVFWIIIFVSIGLMWLTSRLPLCWASVGLATTEVMAKDIGLATVTLCGLLIALFASSSVVSDELEKRTALTVLSKPVSRSQFVVGKFLGIAVAVGLACLVAGVALVIILCMNVIGPHEGEHIDHPDDSVRHELKQRLDRERWLAFKTISQGTYLSFVQVMFLAAISVAIATRATMVVNLSVCIVLFMVGRMANWLKSLIHGPPDVGSALAGATNAAADAGSGVLKVIWSVAYAILPNMDNANAQMTLASGQVLSARFLGLTTLYTALYVIGILLVACALLKRREIG